MTYVRNSPLKTSRTSTSDSGPVSADGERIGEYQQEYNRWINVLGTYQTNRFDVNYRQYTAYSDTQGTDAKISDPVAPELIERAVQKIFERPPKFYVLARGHNLPKEITSIIEGTAQYAWTDPEVIQATGSMREKLKVAGREFCITGNTGVETFYNSEAEAPDFRVIPVEDIIFDPTKTIKKSGVYYIRQYVSLDYLKEHQELSKDGKVVSGRFTNIDRLEAQLGAETVASIKQDPSPYLVTRSGQQVSQRPVDQILLINRWEDGHCCRIANWQLIVEEFDNDILDDDPLDFAMDIEVPKQPYAYSLLDFLNGLTHAKDLFLNQVIDYGSKALNPPLYVDPSVAANPANRASLRNAFKLGGIVMANPQQVNHLPMPPLPTFGFDILNYAQQRAESVTGLNAYLGGTPNATSDKTKGTFGGVKALINQAQSPIRDRQINLEESIVEPITNKMLKYMAALMGKNEVKEVFITGQSPKWVKVTKNLLQGTITLPDLVTAGLVTDNPTPDAQTQQVPLDPMTGQPLKNPQTDYFIGSDADQLAMGIIAEGKNPKSNIIFNVDWILRVETGSMAEQDAAEDIQNLRDWVEFRLQYRIPTDLQKVSEEMGLRMGIKDPTQYDLDLQGPPGQPAPRNASTMPFIFPKETINFKDQPPAGKIQMDQNAGIQLTPQDVAPAQIPPMAGKYPPAGAAQQYASGQMPMQAPVGPNIGQPPPEAMAMGMPPGGAQASPQPAGAMAGMPDQMNPLAGSLPSKPSSLPMLNKPKKGRR